MNRKLVGWLGLALVATSMSAFWAPAGADTGFTAPDPYLVDVAAQSGLDFKCQHWSKNLGFAPRQFIDIFFCASPVLADFNGDGYTDIYFSNMRYNTPMFNVQRDPQDALYLSNGDGTFSNVGSLVGINDKGYSFGAAAVDYDNDGDLDIYVTAYTEHPAGFNSLNSPATVFYKNNGDGTFTQAVPAGLATEFRFAKPDGQWGMTASVADYDHDGDLDIYRGNYAIFKMNDPCCNMPPTLKATTGDTNNLFRNNGDGSFTDVTSATGASLYQGRTFGVNFADLNNDGWADLRVVNDENPDEVYLNVADPDTGARVFQDFSVESGADSPLGGMCAGIGDANNDLNPDLYVGHYEDELDGFFLGNGDGTFADESTMGDLDIGFHTLSWSCPFFDWDNDGDLDLYVANGHMIPGGGEFFHEDDPEDDNGYALPANIFRNMLQETGSLDWDDYRAKSGPGGLDRFVSGGANVADFDFDGSVEILVVNNNDEPTQLYKNTAEGKGHWVSVELRGTTANSHGIGAKVKVEAGSLVQQAEMITGDLLASGSVKPMHFGLADHTGPVTVTVSWPGGASETYSVPADRHVRIVQGSGMEEDTLAPRVDLAVTGTLGANNWYTSPTVTVDLSAVERSAAATSGVASLEYRLDNGPRTAYSGPIPITGEGKHKLWTYASDGAGNSAWYLREFKIDSVAPTTDILEPLAGMVYVQDRAVAPSPTGETIIVAPIRTPNEDVERLDFIITQQLAYLQRTYGLPALPVAPPSPYGTMMSAVGSDGLTAAPTASTDATSGIKAVAFYLDGGWDRTDTSAPYAWDVDLRGQVLGDHTLTATAEDKAGWKASDSLVVKVIPTNRDGLMNTLMTVLGLGLSQVPDLPEVS